MFAVYLPSHAGSMSSFQIPCKLFGIIPIIPYCDSSIALITASATAERVSWV